MESLNYFYFVTMSYIPVKDHFLCTTIDTTPQIGGNQQHRNDAAQFQIELHQVSKNLHSNYVDQYNMYLHAYTVHQ